jgi:hypothetical protein
LIDAIVQVVTERDCDKYGPSKAMMGFENRRIG